MMKNFIQKTKVWVKENQDTVAVTGFVAAGIACYAAVIALAVKADKTQRANEKELMYELGKAASQGSSILPGPDGYFWVIGNQKAS
jgi:phosphotransferase system  glucose/maltose/N-acetylglucosamine-specific IIC component